MFSYKVLFLLLATTSAYPQVPSLVTPDTLIADIGNINNGVTTLNGHLKTYKGGLLASTPLLGDVTVIHLANRKGFADANLAAPANSADSNRIVDFTFATVGVSIPESVKMLKEKKPLFDSAGESSLIKSSMELLLNDHDTFSAALVAKTSPDAVPRANIVVANIHDALESGIEYYSS